MRRSGVSRTLGSVFALGVSLLSLLSLLGQASAQPLWAPGKSYRPKDLVLYAGLDYEVLQAHRSQAGWEPPRVPALWQRGPSGKMMPNWSVGVPYPIGARIAFGGATYQARQAHTAQPGWEPPVAPALWARPADGNIAGWVVQKLYRKGDIALFNGQVYDSLLDHLSGFNLDPLRAATLWRLRNIFFTCANRADGDFCRKDWLLDVFEGAPPARCLAKRCVRVNVPEAVHAYPWTTGVPISVNSVAGLQQAFDQAAAQPSQFFNVAIAPGTYEVSSQLRLKKGSVIVTGDPADPGRVVFKRAVGADTRLFQVKPDSVANKNGTILPFLGIKGVTIRDGRASGFAETGGGIDVENGGLALENSAVLDNRVGGWGAGIAVFNGFLYLNKTLVEGNASSDLNGCGAGDFTTGGGIYVNAEEAYITDSSIIGNQHCRGGGIRTSGSNLHLAQNTIANNQARYWGGGLGAYAGGTLNLKLNTIAGNKSGQANNDDQVRFGGGVALFEFTGQLSMVGNIIAENTNRLAAVPSDFEVGSSTAMVPALDFTVKRGQRNNIKDWTIITSDPQKLNLDAGLFGEDPELAALAPLDLAGRGLPFPNLPTRLPGMTINVHGSYVPPDALDRFFAIPPADQRGFVRPRLDLTTPGSVDPDATAP